MNFVAGGGIAKCATEFDYTARRNNSLSSIGRRFAFGFILTVSLGIAVAFSLVFGAWPIMPFAGIEMAVLYLAFRYIDRHAGDYERITIRGDSVAVEVREGSRVTRHELNRCWAQVVCEAEGARLAARAPTAATSRSGAMCAMSSAPGWRASSRGSSRGLTPDFRGQRENRDWPRFWIQVRKA